ncbi:MAG: NADH-dependent [FeFe] hydrogenase, group A6 [Nanobdellota archaeon]
MVNIKINGREIEAREEDTVLDVAFREGIEIPHLCYEEKVSKPAGCRMCLVEIEGARNLKPACVTKVREGMDIRTHSQRVLDSRKTTLKLLMANHPSCLKCERNLDCKLQKYANELLIDESPYKGNREKEIDKGQVLRRDNSLCILCGQCVRYCSEVQSVHAIDFVDRGVNAKVGCANDMPIDESVCVGCGQCVLHCPTGALEETYEIDEVKDLLNESIKGDTYKHVVVQVAPSLRVSIGELFGYEPGEVLTGKLVTALRRLGFNAVFDTNFGADLTIVEEATELVERLEEGKELPMFTSCCPGWVKFAETFYPDLTENLSTCKSPQEMHASITKTYYAEKKGIKPENVKVVAVMPCTAKKFEKTRHPNKKGFYDVDHVLTTREFGKLCRLFNIDPKDLEDSDFDPALGESTGAGALFGSTGGVMEAALRTAYEKTTGKSLEKVEFDQIRGYKGIKEGSIIINGKEIRFAVAHSLKNARKLADEVKAGKSKYHFIEVMACPGGCIGGGGQPRPSSIKVINKRIKGIQNIDSMKTIRRSHENPSVKKLYEDFLKKPGGKKSHKLLHTEYVKRGKF